MTDYDNFINDRIDGVRAMWEIDFSNATDDAVIDGVIFINNDVNLVVLPTPADGLINIDVHGFVDGNNVFNDQIIVRQQDT